MTLLIPRLFADALALVLFAYVLHCSMGYGKLSPIQNHVAVSERPETSGQDQRISGYAVLVRTDAGGVESNDNVRKL